MNIQTAMFFQLNIPMIIKYDLNNYTYRKLLIDMEISYLNEFIVLAKYQNYFKASQELYIAHLHCLSTLFLWKMSAVIVL